MSFLTLHHVTHQYQDVKVVDQLSLSLNAREHISILGPSGCGKTTLLRMIAGLNRPHEGTIVFEEQTIATPEQSVLAENRPFGMVFQDYSLFPHLCVQDNITFGISQHKSKVEQKHIAKELLELVNLPGSNDKYPHELSGGEQQRIALARALACKPKLILLDEPFSQLDQAIRKRLCREVQTLLHSKNIACILVTHDQSEALSFGHRIAVMNHGKIIQYDTPETVYKNPVNHFCAEFIGRCSMVSPEAWQQLTNQSLPSGCMMLRPEAVCLSYNTGHNCIITSKEFKTGISIYEVKTASGQKLIALAPNTQSFAVGDEVKFTVNEQFAHCIPPSH